MATSVLKLVNLTFPNKSTSPGYCIDYNVGHAMKDLSEKIKSHEKSLQSNSQNKNPKRFGIMKNSKNFRLWRNSSFLVEQHLFPMIWRDIIPLPCDQLYLFIRRQSSWKFQTKRYWIEESFFSPSCGDWRSGLIDICMWSWSWGFHL